MEESFELLFDQFIKLGLMKDDDYIKILKDKSIQRIHVDGQELYFGNIDASIFKDYKKARVLTGNIYFMSIYDHVILLKDRIIKIQNKSLSDVIANLYDHDFELLNEMNNGK